MHKTVVGCREARQCRLQGMPRGYTRLRKLLKSLGLCRNAPRSVLKCVDPTWVRQHGTQLFLSCLSKTT